MSTSKTFTVLTSRIPAKPRDSSVFLVFFPSGSATPFFSSILISTTVIVRTMACRLLTFADAHTERPYSRGQR